MNKTILKGWHFICALFPRLAVSVQYRHILGERINLHNPQDLNEKINYLKFHADLNEWARLSDKYAVREYVKERNLDNILVKLYGRYDNFYQLKADWNNLPNKFVIKANHGCGEVRVVEDKNKINVDDLNKELSDWLKERYGRETAELHYLKIKPCLIVEELLEEPGLMAPTDYKIWCFDGNPYCIIVITGRDEIHHKMYRSMYDLDWNRLMDALPHNDTYTDELIAKPLNLEKMLQYASILSKGHKQVRVDMYNINGKIYFGEMTFTSRGGYNNYSKQILLDMGSQFEVK